ncbi:tyrosine-type recombinase/integrase [Acutalibacter muris]|uniref:tyrosine-type recombinase/integrase n=1 Tax=Acutalibacter muris TaxID=1796620 RepID=UPI00272E0829|nr:tyrosine-type recombinase/integrase [Acutalibacter muris]
MMKYPLSSSFASRIAAFVDYKNSLGHSYEESCRILWKFDTFCCDKFPEKNHFDRDIAMAWLEMRETEGRAGHRNRIMVLREFARYLNAVGEKAYLIPIAMTTKGPRYIPHIFTTSEITAFFYGADHFVPHEKAPARHLVIPVFYRLLYCCGLRPSEARLLRKENVELVRGVLYIEESKGHKDRAVVVADDLLRLMRNYLLKVTSIYPNCPFFFPRYDGMGAYSKLWTEEMFWLCFQMGGITRFDGPKPRVYDFRHTFATECICRWMREGKDVDAMLPFLSAYMGHARFEDTAYYIHMIPDFYQRTGTIDIAAYESLLPEVYDENKG